MPDLATPARSASASDSLLLSRRKALQFLATAPMLPLGAVASASLLSGCATVSGGTYVSASFLPMAAPTLASPAAMATTTVGSSLSVQMAGRAAQSYQLAYQPFFVTGDRVPDGKGGTLLSGGYVDIRNQPIIDRSVAGKERQMFSDSPDGTSLLAVPGASVPGVKGKPVFAVVQFEYTTRDQSGADAYGTLPSPIAVLTLDQDDATG
ncbi:MAG: hypothetical protein JWQ72_1420, partial [Polaromonas sp.]|nr:hypothetical protein [Polaromonas sp.]